MDKLCFIYMNSRALRHMKGGEDELQRIWSEELEETLLNMEDDMVEFERNGDGGEV